MKVDERKYAVIKLGQVRDTGSDVDNSAIDHLAVGGFVSFQNSGDKDEFFVVRLRDLYAQAALAAYADAAEKDDPEYAAEVRDLMRRAGPNSPFTKRPD